jgi:NDP-sugar pyrophosphorylase family protein
MINLITLAGEGSRFKNSKYTMPKPLIPIDGIPMVIRAVDCLPPADKYVFVCKDEHIQKYQIDDLLYSAYNGCEVVAVDKTLSGQALSAEFGIHNSSITPDDSILISCCDYAIEWNPIKYEQSKINSDIVVWSTLNSPSFVACPSSYSWLETISDSVVDVHVKDDYFKDPKNHHAIVGTFWFSKASIYLELVNKIYQSKINTHGEYYIDNIFTNISYSFNTRYFDVDSYYSWGTPVDLEVYCENKVLG